VSWSVPSRLPDGTAELLDDVVSEVLEFIQVCNHLVIIEGFRRSLAEKKDSLEHATVVSRILASRGAASSCGSSLSSSSSLSWTVDSSSGKQLPLAGHLHLCLGCLIYQSQRLSCARLVLLFPGLQAERKASSFLAGSAGAPYMVSLPWARVVLPLQGVKSGQVE
jgi:hypothetical protein